jgi:type IV secretory pathway TraG/TraD family ATPase VirD4
MRNPAIVLCAVAAVAAWQAAASLLFLAVLGFWSTYPWPDRLWMWTRYAIEAPPNAIAHRWLIISGVIAVLPFMGPLFLLARTKQRRDNQDLFGKTGWATTTDMQRSGIERTRLP